MRKRTLNHIFDSLLWYTIYLLPFIVALVNIIGNGLTHNTSYTADFMTEVDTFLNSVLVPYSSNPVFSALYDIFGDLSSFLPSFNGFPIDYLVYLSSCILIHLVFDFIVFIPRVAHKLLSKALKE